LGVCKGCGCGYWLSAGGGELTVLEWPGGVRGDPWGDSEEERLVAVALLLIRGARSDWFGRSAVVSLERVLSDLSKRCRG
jgi:hypothetical protein